MAINTTAQGDIHLSAIANEVNLPWANASEAHYQLRAASALAGFSSPDAMSEFSGYSHGISSVVIQPAAKYQMVSGPRGYTYEAILHGFGQSYGNTYDSTIGAYNNNMSSAVKTDSAQGSIIGSPDLTTWGTSSGAMGTLRSITHQTYGPTQLYSVVMMIVEDTGSNSNAGYTNLVATRSGMTTLTLPRADASYYYSSTNTTRIWLWNEVNFSAVGPYLTGSGQTFTATHDSDLFPGGSGTGSANTTTTDRSTWTVS